MNILGINYIFHDTSACIVSNGKLVFAVEEERLTRDKHTHKFPEHAIRACLEELNTTPEDIDHVAVSINPGRYTMRKAWHAAKLPSGKGTFFDYEFLRIRRRTNALKRWYNRLWRGRRRRPQLHFVDHHLAHIGGSYFVSPYEKAALLSIDGWGEWSTAWLGYAEGLRLSQLSESLFPHSLGCFYSAATEYCGFKPNYDEGKTMGLAPTGDPERFLPIVEQMVRIDEDGRIQVDLDYFCYRDAGGRFFGRKFEEVFGQARREGEQIATHHQDVAAAFQKVLETRVLEMCRVLERRTDADRLVIAGGVALNSVMNGRIIRETRFQDLYVMPGAGDNGTCIGAAYQVFNGILGDRRRVVHDDPYLGSSYSDPSIRATLEECKLRYRRLDDVAAETARLLQDGKIIGWFQGRMEFGPRSLGNRSILANPTIPGMKDKVNAEVKHREAFRPFAPSVPSESKTEYFDIMVDTPFMLKVCDVWPEKRAAIPAVTHVDGTARLQTVHRESNPLFHSLLTEFGRLTGVPVLLNTSFNVMGEPIIESPIQAIQCAFSTGLDALVMGSYLVEK